MKVSAFRILFAAFPLVLSNWAQGQVQYNRLTAYEASLGFQLLFDGTLSSFRSNFVDYIQNDSTNTSLDTAWSVNSAEQSLVRSGYSSVTDIRTINTYRDIDLRLDYRCSGNQGILYRFLINQPRAFYTGVELDIDDNLNQNIKVTAGAAHDIYAPVQPNPYRVFSTNQWNSLQILIIGDSVEHRMNGVKVVGYRYNTAGFWAAVAYSKWSGYQSFTLNVPGDRSSGFIQSGYFGFENDHGGEWHIRNLRFLDDTHGVVRWPPIIVPALKGESAGNPKLELKIEASGLRIQFGAAGVNSIEVYDRVGHLLRRESKPSGRRETFLSDREFRKGIYFLRFETSGGKFHRKVLIQ